MLQKARVVKLVDSLDSDSSAVKGVRVQVPPRAPYIEIKVSSETF